MRVKVTPIKKLVYQNLATIGGTKHTHLKIYTALVISSYPREVSCPGLENLVQGAFDRQPLLRTLVRHGF